MKSIQYASATFALALILAGCKSDTPTAVDAAAGDPPDARDVAQPDAAPDGTAGIADKAPSPADAPSQSEETGRDAPDDVLADIVVTDLPSKDATADLRAQVVDLVAADQATDVPSVDGPGGETSSDAGCSGWTTLDRLSPSALADLLATSDPIVINVHTPYASDIPGTDTSIPYNNVDAIEAYLHDNHCADVVLICLSGGMSQSAGNELIKRGYLRVRDLDGGMQAWQAAGYTLLKDGGL